jgi:hypothetical protein
MPVLPTQDRLDSAEARPKHRRVRGLWPAGLDTVVLKRSAHHAAPSRDMDEPAHSDYAEPDDARRGDCRGPTQASVRPGRELDRHLAGRRMDGGPRRRGVNQANRDGDEASAGPASRRSTFPDRTRRLVRRRRRLNPGGARRRSGRCRFHNRIPRNPPDLHRALEDPVQDHEVTSRRCGSRR